MFRFSEPGPPRGAGVAGRDRFRASVTTRDERELFLFFFVFFVFFVFFFARLFLFFLCLFDTQRYTAELLSEYPEYLRDAQVLIASLLNIPLTHLLIFHLFSGALLRCYPLELLLPQSDFQGKKNF